MPEWSWILQVFAEKVRGSMRGLDPTLFREEAVDFVRENKFLEFDALFAEGFGKGDGLVKRHIAIVVAMNQQYR